MKKISFLLLGILLIFFLPIFTACSPQISPPLSDISLQTIPPSMKGYEIYSWEEEGQWVFKLMTGTNRQKSIEEITSDSDSIQDDTWINIKIYGVDNLKIILGRLPKGEVLFWLSKNSIEAMSDQSVLLAFPPDEIMNDIREFCEQIDIDLTLNQ